MSEEDIKILEDKELYWNYSEKRVLEAIEDLLQSYKEDKAVIYCMIEDIRTRSIDSVYTHEELEQRYRNKVKGEKE